mmetsp:Transcript_3533/g.7973  ORF Transcript_3533/g.7973 Transcript_3533/m.7973 type:complete len:539 (+) Transcript_3533:263-1879(+)
MRTPRTRSRGLFGGAACAAAALLLLVVAAAAEAGAGGKFALKHVPADDVQGGLAASLLDTPHRATEKRRRLLTQNQNQGANPSYALYSVVSGNASAAEDVEASEVVEATSELFGSVMKTGYYAMELLLGTPPQPFQVIVDTGSTITYVPCSFCGDRCGVHASQPFDPQRSRTASFINCMSGMCATFCGSRRCGCRPSLEFLGDIALPMMSVCSYSRKYQEQSSSKGLLLTDTLSLNQVGHFPFGFGCETEETGQIYSQQADGVVGFGNNPSSIVNQLVLQGAMPNTFSLCVGGLGGGGAIFLGDQGVPSLPVDDGTGGGGEGPVMRYAQLQDDPENPEFYSVHLKAIRVGSNQLNVPPAVYQRGYGGVVDSGTTFLYLPAEAHAQFNQILEAEVAKHPDRVRRVPSPDPRYPEDLCYASTPYLANALLFRQHGRGDQRQSEAEREAAAGALLEVFPNITMEMAAAGDPTGARSVEVQFSPANYLFRMASASAPGFCVGVYNNGDAGVLLGSVLMRNHLVNFDLRNKRIGFAEYDCDAL